MIAKRLSSALLVLSVAACGGDAGTPESAAVAAVDTTVGQIEREPLTEADLVDFDMANLSVELPWTSNRINRNPAEGAPRAMVESSEVMSYDGFDRVVLGFGADAPFPGYSIDVVDAGVAIACGDSEETAVGADVAGDYKMVLRLMPARVEEEGRATLALGTDAYGLTRLQEAGAVCAENDAVTWLSGMSNASQIRVLEFRDPSRLVVDVR